MGTTDNFDVPAVGTMGGGDLYTQINAVTGRGAFATEDQLRGRMAGGGALVATTAGATTLTITAASHAGKTVVLNNTGPIAVTLPQATGTGNIYSFFVAVAATGTSSTIKVANSTDVMAGFQFTVTTTSTNVEGFATSATSDTISFNGTTLGGIVGDQYIVQDMKTGVFAVTLFSSSTGTEATPFSAAVP